MGRRPTLAIAAHRQRRMPPARVQPTLSGAQQGGGTVAALVEQAMRAWQLDSACRAQERQARGRGFVAKWFLWSSRHVEGVCCLIFFVEQQAQEGGSLLNVFVEQQAQGRFFSFMGFVEQHDRIAELMD
eukprot:283383-Chlamydomonas_euryale.AAC.1